MKEICYDNSYDAFMSTEMLCDILSKSKRLSIFDGNSKERLMCANLERIHLEPDFIDSLLIWELYATKDEVTMYINPDRKNTLIKYASFIACISEDILCDIIRKHKKFHIYEAQTDRCLMSLDIGPIEFDPSLINTLEIWQLEISKDEVNIFIKPEHPTDEF